MKYLRPAVEFHGYCWIVCYPFVTGNPVHLKTFEQKGQHNDLSHAYITDLLKFMKVEISVPVPNQYSAVL